MIIAYRSLKSDPIVTKTIIVGLDGTSMPYDPEMGFKNETQSISSPHNSNQKTDSTIRLVPISE